MSSGAQYLLRVDADEEILRKLPPCWEDFFGKTDNLREGTVLRIAEEPSLNMLRCTPGWSECFLNGRRQIAYSPKDKPWFTLTYDTPVREVTVCVRQTLNSFVKPGTLYGMLIALSRTCVGLHGVTLQCGGETVILSAPSGTGKSTLAGLLEKYCGARVINGDFALLSVGGEGVMFEPTPFCGTSGVCLNERVRVDRVVFLSQAKENRWQKMPARQALVQLLSNAFVPVFDRQLQRDVEGNILRMLSRLKGNSFAFAPTEEAARLFLNQVSGEAMPSP